MKEHVKKLTETEAMKKVQMIKSKETEPDTTTSPEKEKTPRSRSTTPRGTRKNRLFMNREQVKEWHAQHAKAEAEEEQSPGPATHDISTPEPESRVK